MPGEFFEDRELERDLLNEFPTPLAELFDDLIFERATRNQLDKIIDLHRVSVRLLAFYALAATGEQELPPNALELLRKLAQEKKGLSEGEWIGLTRETVRPLARTPAPFPLSEVAAVFFAPGTHQAAPARAAVERLLATRNEGAHGPSRTDSEIQAIVEQCRPDLEAVMAQLRWLTRAPWFVADDPGAGAAGRIVMEGRRLVGVTPRRGFRSASVTLEVPLDPGVVYALGPAGPLRLGPLVQYRVPAGPEEEAADREEKAPSIFLLERSGRQEARLQAYPGGHKVDSKEAQDWLARRANIERPHAGLIFDVPLVGRRAECEAFRRLLTRLVEERQGKLLIIEGEAGIGKTKFLQFCREEAEPHHVRVLRGAYRGDHAGGAFAGFREALEDLFGIQLLERTTAAGRIAARLGELGYGEQAAEADDLAAFLTQFLRPIQGTGEGGADGLDYLVGRLERFLRRASLHGPLLLLLEDLHWADAESLALLQRLGSVLESDPARLMIVATIRAEDREPNAALEATLQKLARFEGTVYRRRFHRLDEKDTATLIVKSLQAELEDKAAVYDLAGGNPLHVLSILRYLYSEELLETTPTGWRVRPGVQLSEILPTTVRDVIRLRVQRLVTQEDGEARRETLAWAAVAGWRFDVEVLRDAIQAGAPHLSARLDMHLDAFQKAVLLHECRTLPGEKLQFDHHLLREVVLAEQEGPLTVRTRHRCLAAAKLRQVERGDRSLLPEVAHHYLQARAWTEAARCHKLAGDAAQDSLAFLEASGFYETAVRLLRKHPELDLTPDERAGVYEAQAEVLDTRGKLDEALAAHRAAQAEAGENRVRWARNERSAAWFLCLQGRLQEAATASERALAVLEGSDSEIDLADALRTLGFVEICRGHYEAAMSCLQRSLGIYQRSNERAGLARCYGTMAVLYRSRGDLEAMLGAANQAQAIWQELDSPVSLGKALNNAAWCLMHTGRVEDALPLFFEAVKVLERYHVDRVLPNVYHSLAEALLECGRGKEASGYLERGLESARRVGEVRTIADFHCLLARQAAAVGQTMEARIQYKEALRVCEGAGLEPQRAEILLALGEFLLQSGDPEEALPVCEEALAIRRRLGSDGVTEAAAAVNRAREAAPLACC